MFRLDGKKALVTGAASGIGAAIAETFVTAGAHVFLADINYRESCRQVERIPNGSGRAEAIQLDVTHDGDIAKAVLGTGGELDILVNNAGVGGVGTLLESTATDLDRLYAVNVRGAFSVTKAFLPSMIRRGCGNIINLASIGGVLGIRDRLAYCMTKFAVVGFTKCLALDHASHGIRANCICPGRVETPFVSARLAEYPDPEAARREMSSTQLFGRMIQPHEVAAAALYLASDETHMTTGSSLMVDCGWSAGK